MKKVWIHKKKRFTKAMTQHFAQSYNTAKYSLCAMTLIMTCNMVYANTQDSQSSPNHSSSSQGLSNTAQKIEIRGNTIVIQDSACEGQSRSLLSSLQEKQSMQSLATQECESNKH